MTCVIKETNKLQDYVSVILLISMMSIIWKMVTGFGTIIGVSPKTLAYIDTCVFSLFVIGSLVGITITSLLSEIDSLKFKLCMEKRKLTFNANVNNVDANNANVNE